MMVLKSPHEVAIMRQAGRIVAAILERLRAEIRPGTKTRQLDLVAMTELQKYRAKASFKGYRGFPAHLCVSVNDEIVHGIPGERYLNEGDIVSLDFGAIVNGFHGDAAITVGVGEISSKTQELLAVTEAALMVGIQAARNGNHIGDISAAIQNYVEARGFAIVREYSGHGVGRDLHEDPLVPNFGSPGEGPLLQKGMTLAIEPMVTAGDWRTRLGENRWTVRTADGSLSAHFEHTIAISEDEPEILTLL
ncbi:MAG TPA: type I methionyl aminopeptidase [Dehalococcoidia bacterium]|nr:type I methionyl aminopeptidase [Dehalococcoidia bacterium]